VILTVVAGYRMFHNSDVQGASHDSQEAKPETPSVAPTDPSSDPAITPSSAPAPQVASEPKGLSVPPPPPVGGVAPKRTPRPKVVAVQEAKGPAPVVVKDEVPIETLTSPSAAPVEERAETPAPRKGVGYKSLIEANSQSAAPVIKKPPEDDDTKQERKGNRFTRAVGRLFGRSTQKKDQE
jgi:hypothetical protein